MISTYALLERFAIFLSTKIPNKYPTKEDQIEVFNFVLLGVWEELSTVFLLIILSLFLDIITPVIFISFIFATFRNIAGGYHFKTHTRCQFTSLLMFIGSALIIKHTYQYWSIINIYSLLFFCVLMALYIILRYVPRDTPNKQITDEIQIKKFKRWSLYYLISWTVMMTIFLLLGWKLIVIASCFGLLLELFSISILGQIVYSIINNI